MGILDHRRILRLALDNISIFELFRVDQPDHNTVHRILHIRFKLYVVLIRRLEICQNRVVGSRIGGDHLLESERHAC